MRYDTIRLRSQGGPNNSYSAAARFREPIVYPSTSIPYRVPELAFDVGWMFVATFVLLRLWHVPILLFGFRCEANCSRGTC